MGKMQWRWVERLRKHRKTIGYGFLFAVLGVGCILAGYLPFSRSMSGGPVRYSQPEPSGNGQPPAHEKGELPIRGADRALHAPGLSDPFCAVHGGPEDAPSSPQGILPSEPHTQSFPPENRRSAPALPPSEEQNVQLIGIVENGAVQRAILRVGGHQVMLVPGETKDGVTLRSVQGHEAWVSIGEAGQKLELGL